VAVARVQVPNAQHNFLADRMPVALSGAFWRGLAYRVGDVVAANLMALAEIRDPRERGAAVLARELAARMEVAPLWPAAGQRRVPGNADHRALAGDVGHGA